MKKKGLIAVLSFASVGLLACGLVGCAQKDDELAYGEWVTTVEATCEEQGVQVRVCLTDPDKMQERFIPATGHDWNEWQTLTPATCLTEGSQTRSCKTCENSDFQSVKALGHEWGEWETGKAPTCRVAGYETRVCLRDEKHTENNPLDALGHDWSDWIVTTAPTCEELGEKTRYCRNDNAHTENMTASRLYHSWDEWVVTKAPTESEEGEETRTCRYDNEHVETRAALPLGSEGLAFALNDDETGYRVSFQENYRKSARAVYIPESYNGLPVTEVADSAFMNCENLEEVVFCGKSSVYKIGDVAFYGCSKLRQIDLPNSLIEIDGRAFYRCAALESLVIPEGVTTLSHRFLERCVSLRSVSFPSSWIPSKDFWDCPYYFFLGCTSLEEISVRKGNQYVRVQSGCLIERATNKLLYGTKAAVIPEGITAIAEMAFSESEMESIEIPASITEIASEAFEQCENLSRVTFAPNSKLTTLNLSAFYNCTALEYFEIPASVTELTNGGVGRVSVQAVVIAEDNETFVKDGGCIIEKQTGVLRYGGKDAVIPEYVTAIADNAFSVEGLTAETIIIPAGVKRIGRLAFYGNRNLKTITFNRSADGKLLSSLESVGYAFLSETGVQEFEIPASVKTIAEGAFEYQTNLRTLTVEEGNACFKTESGCLIETATNTLYCVLNGAEIPKSVTAIARHAFDVWGDSYIVIPESVTSVEWGAFYNTSNEQTIVLAGFASQEEADAAWRTDWRLGCHALIVYGKN